MKIINMFLEKRWRKKSNFYHDKAQHYYELYKFNKDLAEQSRDPYPIWMNMNGLANFSKKDSEKYLQEYRYWNKQFKKAKKKLKTLH